MGRKQVTQIEVVEDFTSSGKCDEGFLHVKRLRCRNHRDDGSMSKVYRIDVIDRPRLDAVAVLIWRNTDDGLEFLTRFQLRPAAYFRKDKQPAISDGKSHLLVEEIVAGLLETTDKGEEGVKTRAVAEVWEEAGYKVTEDKIQLLGSAFFPAPGILSEKIHLTCVDVTGLQAVEPEGDGTPLEEGARCRFWRADDMLSAFVNGEIQDAKTEIAVRRFLSMKQQSI